MRKPYIRQNEFDALRGRKYQVKQKLLQFIRVYKAVKPSTMLAGAAYCCVTYNLPMSAEEAVAQLEVRIEDFYTNNVPKSQYRPCAFSRIFKLGVGEYHNFYKNLT